MIWSYKLSQITHARQNLVDCFSVDTQTQKPDCVACTKSKQTVEPSAYTLASLTFLSSSIQSYGQIDHRSHTYLAKEPAIFSLVTLHATLATLLSISQATCKRRLRNLDLMDHFLFFKFPSACCTFSSLRTLISSWDIVWILGSMLLPFL